MFNHQTTKSSHTLVVGFMVWDFERASKAPNQTTDAGDDEGFMLFARAMASKACGLPLATGGARRELW